MTPRRLTVASLGVVQVGTQFSHVWEERKLVRLQALTRQLLSENDVSPDDCVEAFACAGGGSWISRSVRSGSGR